MQKTYSKEFHIAVSYKTPQSTPTKDREIAVAGGAWQDKQALRGS